MENKTPYEKLHGIIKLKAGEEEEYDIKKNNNDVIIEFEKMSKNFSKSLVEEDMSERTFSITMNKDEVDKDEVLKNINKMTKIVENSNKSIAFDNKICEEYKELQKKCEKWIDINNKQIKMKGCIIDEFKKSTFNLNYKNNDDLDIEKINDILFGKIKNLSNDILDKIEKTTAFKKLICECLDEKSKNIYLCQICLNENINTCIVPCGHTYCSTCSNKLHNCAICRKGIKQRVKMYIDNNNTEEKNNKNNNDDDDDILASNYDDNYFPVNNSLDYNEENLINNENPTYLEEEYLSDVFIDILPNNNNDNNNNVLNNYQEDPIISNLNQQNNIYNNIFQGIYTLSQTNNYNNILEQINSLVQLNNNSNFTSNNIHIMTNVLSSFIHILSNNSNNTNNNNVINDNDVESSNSDTDSESDDNISD